MKRFYKFWAVVALITGITACSDDPETGTSPEIQLGQTEVTLSTEGTMVTVGYQINNPIEGETIQVLCDAEWLTISTERVRVIELSATVNTASEARTAEVQIQYNGAQSVTLKVTQEAYEKPLLVEITAVDSTSVTFSVTTSIPDFTWVPMATYKDSYEAYKDDEELFQANIELFNYYAEIREMSLQDYLSTILLATGSMSDICLRGFDPSTDYVLYVYGLTAEGVRTTEIYALPFRTEAPYEGEISFEFTAVEEDFVLEFTVTPSQTGVPYYCGIVKESELEEWKTLYGTEDLREAIQQGEIEPKIQRYFDMEMIEERGDYFLMYNEDDIMDWGWEEVDAETKYVIYAAQWDETCNLIGEVYTYVHTTDSVEASDNQISLTIDEITQASVTVSMTTTNEDPYVVIPVKKSDLADLESDDEIFSYILGAYDYLISDYTFEGDDTKTFKRMQPETEYTILAFGCQAGILTTAIVKQECKTLASGDPKDCTFTFLCEPDVEDAWIEVTPSDKGLYYYWMVYPAYYTVEDAKNYISLIIEDYYDGDFATFASWRLSQGDEAEMVWDLYSETEYKVGAVVMDYNTGEYLADMVFSEVFKTGAKTYADIQITLNYGPYYDIQAIVDAGRTDYADRLASGDALLPVTISVAGDCVEFYYDLYRRDLTDTTEWPDDMFLNALWDGSWYESTVFAMTYGETYTLMAVAYDSDYNPSLIKRELVVCTEEGVSPAEEYIATLEPLTLKPASAWQPSVQPATKKEVQDSMNNPQLAEKQAQTKAKIEACRRQRLLSELQARQEARQLRMPYWMPR